jgi:hypothetical protein
MTIPYYDLEYRIIFWCHREFWFKSKIFKVKFGIEMLKILDNHENNIKTLDNCSIFITMLCWCGHFVWIDTICVILAQTLSSKTHPLSSLCPNHLSTLFLVSWVASSITPDTQGKFFYCLFLSLLSSPCPASTHMALAETHMALAESDGECEQGWI